MPDIRHNPDLQRYEICQDGQVIGHLSYRELGDGVVDLPHTKIEPGHEGQGLAGRLVRHALDELRAQGRRVRPTCSYVARYIERHPADQALLEQR